jgi:predicted nucleic acid-binding protein
VNATLIDTNILLDVVTADPVWADWSVAALDAASATGPTRIDDVIYAELSVRFASIESLDGMLRDARIDMAPMPRPALFLAGKAFAEYRGAGGARTGVLPDLFIGAHAAVTGWSLLTRDTRRYRTYFPTVTLISPRPT